MVVGQTDAGYNSAMPRYRITLEYDGGGFVGWQRQENGLSVQRVLEEAITGFCGETVTTFAAGRTDAGVHARGQVAHFDLSREFKPETVRDALNFHLKPAPVAVLDAAQAEAEFHARFSARERRYLYRISNRRAPPALERGRVWWVPSPLDVGAMDRAAEILVGRHDFSSFRAAQCQARSPVKTLAELRVVGTAPDVEVSARAPSFLHHQVRNIVGSLKLVGDGKWSPEDLRSALEARDRSAAGPTAPACGLCLMEVVY